MMIRWIMGVLISIICAAAWAYGDREPPVEVELQTATDLKQAAAFTIVPLNDQKEDHLFDQLAEIVHQELTKRGYREVSAIDAVERSASALAVFITYGVVNVEEFQFTPPVFTRELRLTMLDAAAYARHQVVKRYEAWTVTQGKTGSLAQILPYQMKAIFYSFPGPASAHYIVTVKGMSDNDMVGKPAPSANPSLDFFNSDFPFASSSRL